MFDSPVSALDHPLSIGTLFPLEIQSGVTLVRTGASDPASGPAGDYFQVELIQDQNYFFSVVDDDGTPVDATVRLWRDGVALELGQEGTGAFGSRFPPGRYVIEVMRDGPALASGYQLRLTMRSAAEPATTLTVGPMPAVRLRLVTEAQAAPSPEIPQGPESPGGPSSPPPVRSTPSPTPAPPTLHDPGRAGPGPDVRPEPSPASPPPQGGTDRIPSAALLALSERPLGALVGPDTNNPVAGAHGRALFLAESAPGGSDVRAAEASPPGLLQFTAVATATTEDVRSSRGPTGKHDPAADLVPLDHLVIPLAELGAVEQPLILTSDRSRVVAAQPASDRPVAEVAAGTSDQGEAPAKDVVSAAVPWFPGSLCAATLSLLFSVHRFCSRGRGLAAEKRQHRLPEATPL